jgi:hypothetical protein
MVIFPPDVVVRPEELSKMSGIDYAFMQRMLQSGCPKTEAGLSHNDFLRWTSEHYLEALPGYDVATLPRDGYFSEREQYWILAPVTEWAIHDGGDWLAVGGPGVDGISWAVIKHRRGLSAFYPIARDFVAVADSGPNLISKWTSGRLRL